MTRIHYGRFTAFDAMLGITVLASLTLASSFHYSLSKTYPLGGDGGWDYLTYDPSANRVFISRGMHVVVMAISPTILPRAMAVLTRLLFST